MALPGQYQSIGDTNGSSKSQQKWEALGITKLNEMSFLDLGCNEGFFVEKALEAGASRAVGVDLFGDLLQRAKKRCPDGEFHNLDWMDFLDQQENCSFDVVILLSALHYAKDYKAILSQIRRILKPDGLFIIEGSIAPGTNSFYSPITRGTPPLTDTVWHMTAAKFHDLMSVDFVIRLQGNSVEQPGDPIPRRIYHASPRQPVAVLISGGSGAGKTDLAHLLADEKKCPIYSIDEFILHLIANRYNKTSETLAGAYRPGRLDLVYDLMSTDLDLQNDFIYMFCRNIEQGNIFIIEGIMQEKFKESLIGILKLRLIKTVEVNLSDDYYKRISRFK